MSKHVLKCALGGAAFASAAVAAGALAWTLVQGHLDRRHTVQYWQRRRRERALAAQLEGA